jgi:glycosyltransferase 2 family protein
VTRRAWAVARLAGAATIVAVIVVRLGAGPFLTGLRAVSAGPLLAACGIAVVTTSCCAWRWWLVARGLHVPLGFGAALAAYYRSQFLNSALPGGVLGDLHRGVRHGRDTGDLGRGLRAVFWERTAGQVVQIVVTVALLAMFVSPVRGVALAILVVGVLVALVAGTVLRRGGMRRAILSRGRSRWERARQTISSDVRDGVAAPQIWPGVLGCSIAAQAGHVVTFLIAARATGATLPFAHMLPLAMLVLLAAAVPMNVGGWGPREGAAAWVFAAAGLTAAQGVAAGAAYGALVTAASLPGAVVLGAGALARRRRPPVRPAQTLAAQSLRPQRPVAVLATEGALDG